MGHQTKINERNGAPQTVPKTLAGDVGDFAHDVLTLAELQVQLFATDLQECRRRAFLPGLLLVGGVALGLSCILFALAALALLLIQVFEVTYAAGFLMAAIVGAMLSALLCVIGWVLVRERLAVLRRSREELLCNLRWIKKVLKRNRITRSNRIDNS